MSYYALLIPFNKDETTNQVSYFIMNCADSLALYFKIMLGVIQMDKFASIAAEIDCLTMSNLIDSTEVTRLVNKKLTLVHLATFIFSLVTLFCAGYSMYLIITIGSLDAKS